MSNKAPSAGVKVTSESTSVPPTHEGAGKVDSSSLAAQSSTFQHTNKNATPGSGPAASTESSRHPPGSSGTSSGSLENQSSYAGTAPSIHNRQVRDEGGMPKGKNLKEVESFEPGTKMGDPFKAEIGSNQDPGRAAEARFGIVEGDKGDQGREGKGKMFGALDETSA
ncbi:hypothetical protein GE09DRAFT_1290427 [Coniochaeta sp. 2T2.1]|nr:hypothetical protein GE09DRAFT_1290427 [Coniochaeta sp. 2T2.1]